jgi:hypothetical protein
MPNLNLQPRCKRCSSLQHSTQECPRVNPPELRPPPPVVQCPPLPIPLPLVSPPLPLVSPPLPLVSPPLPLVSPPLPLVSPPLPLVSPPPLFAVEEKNLKRWWTSTNWEWIPVCSECKLPPKTCACNLPDKRVRIQKSKD